MAAKRGQTELFAFLQRNHVPENRYFEYILTFYPAMVFSLTEEYFTNFFIVFEWS